MNRTRETCTYHCEIEAAFAIMGGKWKARIIWHIGEGKPRFNELRDILENVSPRMLAKQLRELERDGLVIRTLHPEIPPRVDYCLTGAGKALVPILESISTWVTEFCPDAAERIG
ncbi:MAG: helix-turn-helix domain-containing protein [Methanoregula sp.]|jgi:DNA-binding HxlR family transcriptional regulator|uniref:winged helix-turn-helix transcriptional regulator n=1 Tax=Methanoregula sp. TaxID=2052170 RepID=UPI003D0DD6FB